MEARWSVGVEITGSGLQGKIGTKKERGAYIEQKMEGFLVQHGNTSRANCGAYLRWWGLEQESIQLLVVHQPVRPRVQPIGDHLGLVL